MTVWQRLRQLDGSFISIEPAVGSNRKWKPLDALPQRAAVVGQLSGTSTVVPNNNADAFTYNGNAYPFVLDPFGIESMRYQQIYSAEQFASGGAIDEIRFRRFEYSLPFSGLELDVEIRLSYAGRSVNDASSVFADNIGEGVISVYDGPLVLSSQGQNPLAAFDIVIDVDNSFEYDPRAG